MQCGGGTVVIYNLAIALNHDLVAQWEGHCEPLCVGGGVGGAVRGAVLGIRSCND